MNPSQAAADTRKRLASDQEPSLRIYRNGRLLPDHLDPADLVGGMSRCRVLASGSPADRFVLISVNRQGHADVVLDLGTQL